MDCPKCGLANPQSAQICDCGYSFSGEPIVRRDAEPSSLVPQPWARYFGRFVDYILFSLPVGLVWGLCRGLGVPLSDNSAVSWLVAMFLWIPVEAAFIAKWGHTPGKWLLRIDVLKDGHRLSYPEAMARALRVWWRGMGTGFPLVALFTILRAYNKLKDTHAASWDRDGGFTVTHKAVSQTRWILALALWAASVAFSVYDRASGRPVGHSGSSSPSTSQVAANTARKNAAPLSPFNAALQDFGRKFEAHPALKRWAATLQTQVLADKISPEEATQKSEAEGALLTARGLLRLDDQAVLARVALLNRMLLAASDDARCAALVRRGGVDQDSLAALAPDDLRAWLDLSLRAAVAEAQDSPPATPASRPDNVKVMQAIERALPKKERSKFVSTLSNVNSAPPAEACWCGRVLYREALGLAEPLRSKAARMLASP